MSLPYKFTDPDGDSLTVALDGDSVLITITQENETAEVLVPAFQLREVAEGVLHALYEAVSEWERYDRAEARAAVTAGGQSDG